MRDLTRRDWWFVLGSGSPILWLAALGSGPPSFSADREGARRFPTPDLGSHYDFLHWIASTQRPRLSFLDSKWKDLEEWKRMARPVFRRQLFYDPEPSPVSSELVGKRETGGLTIESLRLRFCPAYDVPARVLKPAGRQGRLPGVLALHDHSGRYVWGLQKLVSDPGDSRALIEFRRRTYGRAYAEELARRGYVVLVIDAFYFGERRLRPEEMDPETAPPYWREKLRKLKALEPYSRQWCRAVDSFCHEAEHLTAKTIFAAGATWPGILVWDDRRALDYLSSRSDVDPERLGCVGLSIGGLRTAYLIAADPRIKVACVVGWMTEFRAQLRNHLRHHTWMVYVPGLYQWLDLPDAAALIAPGALLVQQCRRDALYPLEAMESAVKKLERIYAKAGIPERIRGTFHDVPHSFTPRMQDEAFEWIDRWI